MGNWPCIGQAATRALQPAIAEDFFHCVPTAIGLDDGNFGEIGCYWHAFVFCIGRVLVEHSSSSHRLHPTRIVTPLYTDGHCDLDDNIGTQLLVQIGLLEHSWTSQK